MACLHFTDEIGLSEPLKLTQCDELQSVAKDSFDAKSKTSVSGAELNKGNGMIHIHAAFPPCLNGRDSLYSILAATQASASIPRWEQASRVRMRMSASSSSLHVMARPWT